MLVLVLVLLLLLVLVLAQPVLLPHADAVAAAERDRGEHAVPAGRARLVCRARAGIYFMISCSVVDSVSYPCR